MKTMISTVCSKCGLGNKCDFYEATIISRKTENVNRNFPQCVKRFLWDVLERKYFEKVTETFVCLLA